LSADYPIPALFENRPSLSHPRGCEARMLLIHNSPRRRGERAWIVKGEKELACSNEEMRSTFGGLSSCVVKLCGTTGPEVYVCLPARQSYIRLNEPVVTTRKSWVDAMILILSTRLQSLLSEQALRNLKRSHFRNRVIVLR
ncbi:unnamed protein product, partial [Timema podura]|nr:unnamed protein product [Timema podura]